MPVEGLIKQALAQHCHTWLVTGAAGFIGSHLTEALLKLNQNVIGIDNFSTGHRRNVQAVLEQVSARQGRRFQLIEMDIRHPSACRRVMQGIDYVLHHAAFVSVPDSMNQPELANAVNIEGFLNVLCAANAAKVKRFVYASSSAVYGDAESLPLTETCQANPLSPYAVTKFTNELYAETFARCYSIETIGLRYFNVFGSRQNPKGAYAAVIPLWLSALLQGNPVHIYGDGETSRDFCYISNVVQANLLAALTTNRQALNTVYNIATGHEITLNQLYRMMSDTLALHDIPPVYSHFRAGDIRRSWACIEKARHYLGYQPQYGVQQGLYEIKSWYEHNLWQENHRHKKVYTHLRT